jgi:hypothetical protein
MPQTPTRRNWRAMILATDQEASKFIQDKIDSLLVFSVSVLLTTQNQIESQRAFEIFQSLSLCNVGCQLRYQPYVEAAFDSATTTQIKLYCPAECTETY